MLDGLLEAPEHPGCCELVTLLRTAHPAAPRLRATLDERLAEPRDRALAVPSRTLAGP